MGGGNFACSMSNISTFFPKRLQGTALGINAGLGNFGVTTMQILIPLVMTAGMFGALGGESMSWSRTAAGFSARFSAGTPTFIQNAGFVWVLSLVPLAIIGLFGMNNLLPVAPDIGCTLFAFAKVTWLYALAFVPASVRPLPLPACAHRARPAQHVGGDAADHDQHPAHDEARGLRHDEGKHQQAVRDFQQQAHLVDDGALPASPSAPSSASRWRCRCRSR